MTKITQTTGADLAAAVAKPDHAPLSDKALRRAAVDARFGHDELREAIKCEATDRVRLIEAARARLRTALATLGDAS